MRAEKSVVGAGESSVERRVRTRSSPRKSRLSHYNANRCMATFVPLTYLLTEPATSTAAVQRYVLLLLLVESGADGGGCELFNRRWGK